MLVANIKIWKSHINIKEDWDLYQAYVDFLAILDCKTPIRAGSL